MVAVKSYLPGQPDRMIIWSVPYRIHKQTDIPVVIAIHYWVVMSNKDIHDAVLRITSKALDEGTVLVGVSDCFQWRG